MNDEDLINGEEEVADKNPEKEAEFEVTEEHQIGDSVELFFTKSKASEFDDLCAQGRKKAFGIAHQGTLEEIVLLALKTYVEKSKS